MIKTRIFITALAVSLISVAAHAQTPDISSLPRAIEQLGSEDESVVCAALDEMGRLCDQSCTPYIADMLRHIDPDVAKAAAHAAMALANPKIAPALREIVRHHPVDDVRLEALKALIRIAHDDDFEALLAIVDPEKIDEIQRRIVRSLPASLTAQKAPHYAALTQYPALVSSAVSAYRRAPELLFDAILDEIAAHASTGAIPQHLRALALLAPMLAKDYAPNTMRIRVFDDIPVQYRGIAAAVIASTAMPQAAQWLLTRLKSLSADVVLQIFENMRGDTAVQIIDAVLQTPDSDTQNICWARDIRGNPALNAVFLQKLAETDHPKGKTIALGILNGTDTISIRAAVPILAAFTDDPAVRDKILALIGHPDPETAFNAAQAAAKDPAFWKPLVQIIEKNPGDDHYGKTYLARYALVMLAAAHPEIPPADFEPALSEARRVIQNPARLHADPALWLLAARGQTTQPPELKSFQSYRGDIKRALMRIIDFNDPSAHPVLKAALLDHDEAVAAEALDILGRLDIDIQNTDIDDLLRRNISSDSTIRITHAMIAAARRARTALIPVITDRLVDARTDIAYDALWALQKMRALPDQHWLKSLYYRAPDGILRDRLGFLTKLDDNRRENFAAQEIRTQTRVHSGQIVQMRSQNQPMAAADAEFLLDDQSLVILRTNAFGWIKIP